MVPRRAPEQALSIPKKSLPLPRKVDAPMIFAWNMKWKGAPVIICLNSLARAAPRSPWSLMGPTEARSAAKGSIAKTKAVATAVTMNAPNFGRKRMVAGKRKRQAYPHRGSNIEQAECA